jgi:hypothetical protein
VSGSRRMSRSVRMHEPVVEAMGVWPASAGRALFDAAPPVIEPRRVAIRRRVLGLIGPWHPGGSGEPGSYIHQRLTAMLACDDVISFRRPIRFVSVALAMR